MENDKKEITASDLAQAFSEQQPGEKQLDEKQLSPESKPAKTKKKKSNRFIVSVVVFVIGLITFICGAVFLILDFIRVPDLADGEYLISADEWVLENGTNCTNDTETETNCMPSVIWKFTDIGKGTLTTNNHINDYDFAWAIKDGKLLIETNWLYELENEYEFKLNQKEKTLTLIDGEKEITFTGRFTDKQ
ncbi:hypothetical protein IKD49_01210 [Candidatus Saccharibacteria bacterium]|nr:hypothetical protein [Candidatus Saccharibacteria bacterium]